MDVSRCSLDECLAERERERVERRKSGTGTLEGRTRWLQCGFVTTPKPIPAYTHTHFVSISSNPNPNSSHPIPSHPSTMSTATSSTTATDLSSMDTKSTVSAPIILNSKKTIKPQPRVTLSSFTPNNVGTLRKLNNAILPVAYSNKYYAEVLDASLEDFNKLVYYADVPVGSISSRFESFPPSTTSTSSVSSTSTTDLHILTLAVLPAYRSQGLGAQLLKHVLDRARTLTSPDGKKIDSVFVYCQVGNEIAKEFYVKNGFEVVETVANYYSARIEPRDAFLLRHQL